MKHLALIASAVACLSAAPAAAETIDFTGVTPGYTSNPLVIGSASFSTVGTGLFVSDFGFGSGNMICATPDGSTCSGVLQIDFASAVYGLTFIYAGVDSQAASVSVMLSYFGGGSGMFDFTPIGDNGFVDLSAYSDIVSASISTSDSAGLVYDNFTFGTGGAVPEPSTWAMLIIGFGAVGARLRRKKPRVATVFA